MIKPTVIQNAQVVLENGILWDGIIVINNGKIMQIGSRREIQIPPGAHCIDAKGAYVGPGFVDIHVHGSSEYSTCFEPEEAAQFFLQHGTTTILSTPDYLMPKETLLDAISKIRNAMKTEPVIKGIYMEGPFTNPKYGAHSDLNPWQNGVDSDTFKALADACGTDVKVWTIAPELPDLMPFLEYARKINPDVVFAVGHSEATPM